MNPRSIGLIGIVLVAIAVGGPAQAFPEDSDDSRQDSASERPSDYRYSGTGFNFSMSRTPTEPKGAVPANSADTESDQAQPRRERPGFFQRVIHSVFGSD